MNRTLVLAEWYRAGQALRAAEVLTDAGYPADALSRAYYATLHAARAALYVHNVVTASHAAVRRMFGLHLAADYDVETVFTSKEAGQACQRARAFLDRLQNYLLTKDFTANELSPEAGPL